MHLLVLFTKKVLVSSEKLVSVNSTTRRHTPEDNYLNILRVRTSPLTRVWYTHVNCIDTRVFAPIPTDHFSSNLSQSAVNQCYHPITVLMQVISLKLNLLWGINRLKIFQVFTKYFYSKDGRILKSYTLWKA